MCSYESAVVIDNGSYNVRVGLSTDEAPSVLPPVVAHAEEAVFIGHESKNRNAVTRRIIDAQVTNWGDLEKIWEYCYTDVLKVKKEEHPVLLTNIEFNYRYEKEKMTQIMFENFNVPTLFLAEQTVLSLYSSGCLTGLVLHSGFKKSQAIPVYEGYIMHYPVHKALYVAGDEITSSLLDHLRKKGHNCDYETANAIKEKLCRVSPDFQKEEVAELAYKLPDGQIVKIGKEQVALAEELFKPKCHWYGIHQMVFDLVSRCDFELQHPLFANMVLAGGNTLLSGFPQRLYREIRALGRQDHKVIARDNREISAWVGGTVVASLPTFRQMWITRKEYDEYGPGIVRRKCF